MMSAASDRVLPATLANRWFDDYAPGAVCEYGPVVVTVDEIVDARRSKSKPDRGLVRSRVEAFNQRGEIVQSFLAMNPARRRADAPPR